MSVNSSSPANTTSTLLYHCFDLNVNIFISAPFTITKFVLSFPLSIFVLHLGHQRRRRSSKATSHSDFFSLQMAVMELVNMTGWLLFSCGTYMDLQQMMIVGFYVFFFIFPGQICFHMFTCVERYVAVVHPVTYLSVRQSRGVRIRNISTGCVWLLCFGWSGVMGLYMPEVPIAPFLSFLSFSLLVISFCSLSVLQVLIRPGPGHVGKVRERVDQSKQRAFYTIMSIMAVLWLMFVGLLVCTALDASTLLSDTEGCVVMISAIWFNLPPSLVLPLLYLHRAGKPPFCCSNAENHR